ncbi:transcription factor HES-5-like [Trachinotus anak]|uniref:transcription factor HES-5-like n=1 Tax=Trachinotus anak TaxID=443729 RepID=UPI0039F1F824
MKPAEIRFSLQRPLQHRDPAMAPTITAAMTNSQDHLTLTHKLRKPLVEKLRRERINSSIEQLKSLLGPQFLKQQPDSKLEKADILEMTVCFLRRLQQQLQQQQQQQHQAVDSAAVDQGYSRCVQEVARFLSKEEVKTHTQRRLLNHVNKLQSSSDNNLREADFSLLSSTVHTSITKDKSPVTSVVWRPW